MLQKVPLANITALPNYRTIDIDNGEFKDLVASIKKDDVLQPGLARPNAKKPGHYELIFGNRRFAAAIEAGKKEFPLNIKDVADDDVLEFQIMENLQRKDVHPMDEAAGFKAYQLKKKCDVKELAAVFAKSERYITNRLALTNLNADLQKDFLKGLLTVGQAEMFAKLSAAQQKELKGETYDRYNENYVHVDTIRRRIETMFLLKLSAAKWDLQDATLVVKAGACSTCKKRTSCSGLLFDDITKDDRCLDKKCFQQKNDAWFADEVEKIATTKPNIVFLKNYQDCSKAVLDTANKYNIKVLKYSDSGVQTYKTNDTAAVKSFVISGNDRGCYKTIYVRTGKKINKDNKSSSNINLQVVEINSRLTRAKELDYEKVQERVVKSLKEAAPSESLAIVDANPVLFHILVRFILFDIAARYDDDLRLQLGIDITDEDFDHEEKPDVLKTRLLNMSDVQTANLLKEVILNKYQHEKRESSRTYFLRLLAEWFGIDVAALVAEQQAAAVKREQNAAKRIEALKKPAKEEPAAKSATPAKKPVKAKKTAIKKPAAKAKVKPSKKKAA